MLHNFLDIHYEQRDTCHFGCCAYVLFHHGLSREPSQLLEVFSCSRVLRSACRLGISTLKVYSRPGMERTCEKITHHQQTPSKSTVSGKLTFNKGGQRKNALPCRCQVDPRESERDSGSRWPLQHSGALQGQRASGGQLKRRFLDLAG